MRSYQIPKDRKCTNVHVSPHNNNLCPIFQIETQWKLHIGPKTWKTFLHKNPNMKTIRHFETHMVPIYV
jgi:hypothetical protein